VAAASLEARRRRAHRDGIEDERDRIGAVAEHKERHARHDHEAHHAADRE